MDKALRGIRKLGIALIGITVIGIGLALLVLPGPGLLVIAAGLAILAIEFEWARRHHQRLRKTLSKSIDIVRSRKNT